MNDAMFLAMIVALAATMWGLTWFCSRLQRKAGQR